MKRALLVTYHCPPAVGSGVQRMQSLRKYLPRFGWDVDVLAPSRNVYPDAADSARSGDDGPATSPVIRAPAVDSARHLALAGRYPLTLALPDRWVSWSWTGVPVGLRLARRRAYSAIISSFPIASAHLLAARLAHRTGLPWLADFRDPMAQDEYPAERRTWHSYHAVEQRAVTDASALVFTAPGALAYYQARYPAVPASKWHLVSNGYDPDLFRDRASGTVTTVPAVAEFLHSGLLYPWERDPLPLFDAIAELEQEGFWREFPTRFVFRASGFDAQFAPEVAARGVQHLVEFRPRLDYAAALDEICRADALMLLQADNSNFQIPAKTYEYLRSGRPIVGLLDPAGDTAALLTACGVGPIAPINKREAIADVLRAVRTDLAAGNARGVSPQDSESFSRRERARDFAAILDAISAH